MRILLVVLQYPPDTDGTGQLMSQLCAGLTEHGHEVTVLTTFPHYEHFRVREEFRGRLLKREKLQDHTIIRLFTYAPGKKSMINRLLSYLTFNGLATLTAALSRQPWDAILCTNGSFFTGLTGWLLGKIKYAPFIYNVQDLYPDVPIRAGQLHNRHVIATLRALEKFMYRKASHITVISPSFRENLVSRGVPPAKISVIPNFADTEFIRPFPKINAFSRQHDLADKFVITHAGNVGYVYDLETLIDAASLISSKKDIVILIVGNGVARSGLEKKAKELELDNVRFLPFQPRENLPWLRASSDVQVSLYKSGAALDSFPSKIYEIMASGRPLLASAERNSEVERLVKSAACGACVTPGDAGQLADAILHLYRDPLLRQMLGEQGRRYAVKHFSRPAISARYHELFQRISPSQPFTKYRRISSV